MEPPCRLCSNSHQGQVKGRENVTSNLSKDIFCGSRGDTRPGVQLLCPRAALPAPNWMSHPAETPALLWWEAVPGRADGSWIENPWKGRFHRVFPLVVPQSSCRDRQGSGAEHSTPAPSVLTEGRHWPPKPPISSCLWTQETLPSQTLDFTSQRLQLNPGPSSVGWTHQGQHIHQGSPGLSVPSPL